ncbi:MAG: AhpC/TSA family protein [Planctomycetota bacterium]|nr:MAG: AhpC/TSA family protein [Planctomycetota bacterium]
MIKRATSALAICLGLAVAVARADEAKIPAVGDKAPDFTLEDLDGQSVSLEKLKPDAPVVLVVLRGYPGYQCPICSFQVSNLLKHAEDFKSAGAQVVLVYPGPADDLDARAAEFIKGKSLPDNFAFVTDPGYEFTNAYGLRWDAPRETAYPSTFVIGTDGNVRFAKVSKTHGGRANTAKVLEALSGGK